MITHAGNSYTIGKYLNAGGFAAVYECTDDWGNELVAKVLEPRNVRSYEECCAIANRELENLKRLRHPNITYLYDAFECDDTCYLIIERCHQTFADLFSAPWFQGNIWFHPLARQLLQAVHFIHENGIVHKDIHPGNVFVKLQQSALVSDEAVLIFKIGDLGIARLEEQIDQLGGTLALWMLPPESIDGAQFGPVDRHVDIYHSALLLLSLLLGYVPSFTESEILDGLPRRTAENLDSPYGWALAKALRRHVNDRTQSALESWKDLELANESIAVAA